MSAIVTTGPQAVQKNPVKDIGAIIASDAFKRKLAQALPRHMTADRFARVAITAIMRVPKLLQCSQESLFQAMLDCSAFGLEPNGRDAHLIPYGNECKLILDYKGLVQLAIRSGQISSIHADKICENDDFEYDCGEVRRHRVDFRGERGNAYAYWARATFKDGSTKCEVMSRHEVDAIRKRSKSANNGPWVTDYDEMAKKTVFKRLSKWLPISPELADALNTEDDEYRKVQPVSLDMTPMLETSDLTPSADENRGHDGAAAVAADIAADAPFEMAAEQPTVQQAARGFRMPTKGGK